MNEILFIGGGLSTSLTIFNFIKLVEEKKIKKTIQITVIEEKDDVWSGIPYGYKAGKDSLTITTLKEFIPQPYRIDFFDWLKKNKTELLANCTSQIAQIWFVENKCKIESDLWEDICIPRYWFGKYLKELMSETNKSIANLGVKLTILKGKAIDIEYKNEFYTISYISNDSNDSNNVNRIITKSCILALGSLPNKKLTITDVPKNKNLLLIQNIYDSTLSETLHLLNKQMNLNKAKDILIIGSNASCVEFVYNLNEELLQNTGKIKVLSTSGKFPLLLNETETGNKHLVFENLNTVLIKQNPTASQLMKAAQQDFDKHLVINKNSTLIIREIAQKIIQLLDSLPFVEQENFVYKYGEAYIKMLRKVEKDYGNKLYSLLTLDKIQNIKGSFLSVNFLTNNSTGQVKYTDEKKRTQILPNIASIINCSGFENIHDSTDELIQNLLRRKIIIPTQSLKGIKVNECFKANNNLYIMGPLLAGNINTKMRLWHAESATRIFNLSSLLAQHLYKSLS